MKALREVCRVRFAPSPTGSLHLGSLRTALFNFLFARKRQGVFALRIEDTDQSRLVSGCIAEFENLLNDYGLRPNESPSLGGPYGPYVQSKRLHLYRFYTEMLMDSGHVYPCFCTSQRLDLIRRDALRNRSNARYDGRCRALSREEVRARLADAQPHVIRFKFDAGDVLVSDSVFGSNVHHVDEGDFVIIKSDGFPTYHFANVVDDHSMQFTHVIRGAEWLPSTPKHIRIYEAFGWRQPTWMHLPLITRDGSRKLSKRDADAFTRHYDRDQGYSPLAVLNFLLRNGSGIRDFDPTHLYSVDEMIENFDETLITRNNFMMDPTSLRRYGRMAFRGADFHADVYPIVARRLRAYFAEHDTPVGETLLDAEYVRRVVNFLLRNEEAFDRLALLVGGPFFFFFHWPAEQVATRLRAMKIPADTMAKWLRVILDQKFPDGWRHDALRRLVSSTSFDDASFSYQPSPTNDNDCGESGDSNKRYGSEPIITYRRLAALLRTALTGAPSGPPLFELIDFLGESECSRRVAATIAQLEQPSDDEWTTLKTAKT